MNTNVTHIQDDESIIQKTSLHLNEGLLPRRIVLRDLGEKFVTHMETMTITCTGHHLHCQHHAFGDGNYFDYGRMGAPTKEEAREAAEKDFDDRAARL